MACIRAIRCPPEYTLRLALRSLSIESKRSTATTGSSSASSYRAVVCNELGKPLSFETRPWRPIEAKQIRVAVDYAAVNFGDILQLAGNYQVKPKLPFVPGGECCGQVLEVGDDVSDVRPGDRIIGFLGIGAQDGGYSEEIVMEHGYYKVASHLPEAEGAAVGISYGTAYMSLVRYARIKAGDVVLVSAAAGALGLATVDLAANVFGAKVIGVCGGAEKCKLVKSYGAYETIDYNHENVRDEIKKLTNGNGVDIVVDMVGGKLLDDCLRSTAFDGRILTLGYAGGQIPSIAANLLLVKNISVQGVFFGSHAFRNPVVFHETMTEVLKLWTDKKIRPHIGRIFPLHEANEALQYVANRKSTGKVLLKCRKL